MTAQKSRLGSKTDPLVSILRECEAKRKEIGCDKSSDCWYRGQRDARWRLTPGLFRDLEIAEPWSSLGAKKRRLRQQAVRQRETDLFWEAFTQARELHATDPGGWEALFLMQHHLFPTRLLDWSETLGTALYFAISDFGLEAHPNAAAAVWLLNPNRLNDKSWGERDVDLIDPRNLGWDKDEEEYYDYRDYMTQEYEDDYSDGPVAIYPAQKSERMRAQAGRFTIHGRDLSPLDEIYGKGSKIWRKVEIRSMQFRAFGSSWRSVA